MRPLTIKPPASALLHALIARFRRVYSVPFVFPAYEAAILARSKARAEEAYTHGTVTGRTSHNRPSLHELPREVASS